MLAPAVGLVVSLASPASAAAPPSEDVLDLPAGVAVAVEFPRYLRVDRDLEVIVDNQSDSDIVVLELALSSPLFESVEPRRLDGYLVRDRWRNDFRIDFGPANCPAPDEPSFVEMTLGIDGEVIRGFVRIDAEPLQRISEAECGERFVFENAAIAISDEFSIDGDEVLATIDVTRRSGDERIVVETIRGAILYGLEAVEDADPVASLEAGADHLSIPVTLRVIRCDPHAAADVKIPFAFTAWITVGEHPTQPISIPTAEPVKVALESLLGGCLAASTG